jgi:tRNA(Ile)-lysidine synthase
VALGHTRDDQAETVIIRLVRGTGIDGLAAMAPLRDDLWIRPLLVVARQGVREYARRRSLDWLDDPTNADPRFLRNRVRREVIPLLEELDPGIAGRLASLAGEARRVRAARQPLVRAACEHAAAQGGEDWTVRASELRRMDPALAALVVREVLRLARGDLRGVGRVHVEAILAAASRSAGSTRVDLPGPVRVVRSYDDVVFTRRPARRPDRHAAVEVRGPGRYVLGPHAVRVRPRGGARSRFPLVLRHRRPGDRLAGRTRKLKRLLIDLKVPADLRDMVPLLASGAEVVWAGGLFVRPGAGVEVEMDGCGPSPYLEWLQSRRE